jgi:hypothetical protein
MISLGLALSGYSPKVPIPTFGRAFLIAMTVLVWRSLASGFCRRAAHPLWGTLSGLLALSLSPSPSHAALFTVTQNTWGSTSDVGSFAWAIEQANLSGGADVIAVADGLQIDVDAATATSSPFNMATISESVTILGNNARLVGNPSFLIKPSTIVTKDNPQKPIYQPIGTDIPLEDSFSFLKIGTFGADNSGISVSISNLNTNGLNRIAQVNNGASLRYSGSAFEQSVNFTGGPTGCCFSGFAGSTINLDNVLIRDAHTFNSPIDLAFDAMISDEDAILNISNSRIERSAGGGAISLVGGVANVVSSVLFGSGGVSATGGTLKFVNSLAYLTGPLENGGLDDDVRSNRFIAGDGGLIEVIASTILSDNATILEDPDKGFNNGVPLTAVDGGRIQLSSSAVLATEFGGLPNQIAYYASPGPGGFSADALSWVRPTSTQSAADLRTLFQQPGLLTGEPGIPVEVALVDPLVEFLLPYPQGAYPAVPGVLVNVVPDAGPGGGNELINPIDGSPITTDVFGNPRTTNGFRNVGAVQDVGAVQAEVPGPLPLLGVASAYGWCRRLRRKSRIHGR